METAAVPERKRRLRFLRFGLRTLFAFSTLASVVAALWFYYVAPYRDQAAASDELRAQGALLGKRSVDAPFWQVWLVGAENLYEVTSVEIDASPAARPFGPFAETNDRRILELCSRLFALQDLSITDAQLEDRDLALLRGLPRLRHLDLYKIPLSDSGLEHIATLERLESLDLTDTRVSDDGLSKMARLRNLKALSVLSPNVRAEGWERLNSASTLEELSVTGITPLEKSPLVVLYRPATYRVAPEDPLGIVMAFASRNRLGRLTQRNSALDTHGYDLETTFADTSFTVTTPSGETYRLRADVEPDPRPRTVMFRQGFPHWIRLTSAGFSLDHVSPATRVGIMKGVWKSPPAEAFDLPGRYRIKLSGQLHSAAQLDESRPQAATFVPIPFETHEMLIVVDKDVPTIEETRAAAAKALSARYANESFVWGWPGEFPSRSFVLGNGPAGRVLFAATARENFMELPFYETSLSAEGDFRRVEKQIVQGSPRRRAPWFFGIRD